MSVQVPEREFLWPCDRFPEAVREAIRRSGLPTMGVNVPPISPPLYGTNVIRWACHAPRELGFEGIHQYVEPLKLPLLLDSPGPCLVVCNLPGADAQGIPVVVGAGGMCTVIRPDGSEWRLHQLAFCEAVHAATRGDEALARLFSGLEGGEAAYEEVGKSDGVGCLLGVVRLQLDAAHPLLQQLRSAGDVGLLAWYMVVILVQAAVAVGAAWTLGNAAVTGLIDAGRIAAWSMLAASDVPLQYLASLLLGRLSIDFGTVVKKRLLEGTLFVGEAEVKKLGFGAILARLGEASVIEQTSVAELVGVLAPIAQLTGAFVLLLKGALPGWLVAALTLFVAGAIALGVGLSRRYATWYAARLDLTDDLVSKIIGHRTRAVQDNPTRLHDAEDDTLDQYARLSTRYDHLAALSAVYGRLWLAVSGVALLWAFVFRADKGALLLSGVGAFLAYRALVSLDATGERLISWVSAWKGIRSLFIAGRTRARPARSSGDTEGDGLDTVVSSLSFAYRAGGRPVFSDASLRIRNGERLLVEGPSGGGKSTFSKLLTGELRPTAGTILVDGVDCFSVSEAGWRRRVASSPQFHENYLFAHTFGFNVDPTSLEGEMSPDALQVCEELGLDRLLAKMPSGQAQVLGETGWQLSHGERSRVFVARCLLQGASLLIFDESFGALDPETLARAVECIRRRTRTLVVIAHT
jgi:ATP-binding cassette subfamily B protein